MEKRDREIEADAKDRSRFTAADRRELADCMMLLGMTPDAGIPDGRIIDECEELYQAAKCVGYEVVEGTLHRLYEKSQAVKKEMMDALDDGPLVNLGVAKDENFVPYHKRCSLYRMRFPVSVREEAARRELFIDEDGLELRTLDLKRLEDREILALCERIIDLTRFVHCFFRVGEYIKPALANDFRVDYELGRPVSPSFLEAVDRMDADLKARIESDPSALAAMAKLQTLMAVYQSDLRKKGALVKIPREDTLNSLRLAMALRMGRAGSC